MSPPGLTHNGTSSWPPKAMFPALQSYFQNWMILSFPNQFHLITPLSETWFSLYKKPGPTIQSLMFPISVKQVSLPHSSMLITVPLPHFSFRTCDTSPLLPWISVLQGEPASIIFRKICYDHSGPSQLMVPSINIYNAISNNCASNDVF